MHLNKCSAHQKNIINGTSLVFREVDGARVMLCKPCDTQILYFLKELSDEFDTLNQTVHYIKYPGTTFMLTQEQYHQFEGLLVALEDMYD